MPEREEEAARLWQGADRSVELLRSKEEVYNLRYFPISGGNDAQAG